MTLDVERNTDFMWKSGDIAVLTIGPFQFWINTADDTRFGFAVTILGRALGWSVTGAEE